MQPEPSAKRSALILTAPALDLTPHDDPHASAALPPPSVTWELATQMTSSPVPGIWSESGSPVRPFSCTCTLQLLSPLVLPLLTWLVQVRPDRPDQRRDAPRRRHPGIRHGGLDFVPGEAGGGQRHTGAGRNDSHETRTTHTILLPLSSISLLMRRLRRPTLDNSRAGRQENRVTQRAVIQEARPSTRTRRSANSQTPSRAM